MAKFGKSSLAKLATCHPDLQAIAAELIKELDVTVIAGHRDQTEQHQAFINGASKLDWPRSKHNSIPSQAMDLAPIVDGKLDWNNIVAFIDMCKRVEAIAKRLGIKVRMGRDFSFKDYPHCELSEKHNKGKF